MSESRDQLDERAHVEVQVHPSALTKHSQKSPLSSDSNPTLTHIPRLKAPAHPILLHQSPRQLGGLEPHGCFRTPRPGAPQGPCERHPVADLDALSCPSSTSESDREGCPDTARLALATKTQALHLHSMHLARYREDQRARPISPLA